MCTPEIQISQWLSIWLLQETDEQMSSRDLPSTVLLFFDIAAVNVADLFTSCPKESEPHKTKTPFVFFCSSNYYSLGLLGNILFG